MPAKVSVIIPCFNREHLIADAIRSALPEADEIIVVDDGSTDHSAEVASQFRVQVIRTENRGVSAARNTGIEAATGDFIRLLDSDDMLAPGSTKWMLKAFDGRIVIGQAKVLGTTRYGFPERSGELHPSDILSNTLPGCLCLFPKDALKGGFDESLTISEDYVLAARLCAEGWKFVQYPQIACHIRDHSGPRLTRKYGAVGYRKQLEALHAAAHHMPSERPRINRVAWALGRAASRDRLKPEARALFTFADKTPYLYEREQALELVKTVMRRHFL